MKKRTQPADVYVSRVSQGPDDADSFRLQIDLRDPRRSVVVVMNAQQFAEMLTAKVTRVYATETEFDR